MAKALDRGCGVYILNSDGSKVLLTQRGPASRSEQFRWEGPGGVVEPGESYEQAAHREIKEELGIDITLGDAIGPDVIVTDNKGKQWQCRIFKASTKDTPVIQEPDKCVGFGWFSKDEVARLSLAAYSVKDFEMLGWL